MKEKNVQRVTRFFNSILRKDVSAPCCLLQKCAQENISTGKETYGIVSPSKVRVRMQKYWKGSGIVTRKHLYSSQYQRSLHFSVTLTFFPVRSIL